jgi:hypothetical protein
MKTKTLAELVAEVKDAYQGVLRRALDARHRMDAALASLEAALARPPADSELDRLRMREPRREEMEAALGEANEAFYEGWTIRRCRHCRIPVAGGPTACEVCAATQDPDKNPWPPPKVAGAVGQWDAAIAAVAAERAREREVKLDVVGTSELVFGAGKWSAYRLVGPHALCIRAALGLVDADTGTSLSLAIRRLDPQGPRAKRPWRLKTGRMICAECQQDVPPKWLMCDNGDCPQYGKPWGKPRYLPSGEEVGG